MHHDFPDSFPQGVRVSFAISEKLASCRDVFGISHQLVSQLVLQLVPRGTSHSPRKEILLEAQSWADGNAEDWVLAAVVR